MKEAFDNFWFPLQTPKMGYGLGLHGFFGNVLEPPHNPGFEISPNPFIWIELGRIAGQDMQRDLSIEGIDVASDLFRLVGGMPIDDQKYFAFGAMNQTSDEFDELICSNCSLHHHESQHSLRANCGNHVEAESSTGRSNHWSFPFRCPSGSRVIVGTDTGFVAEPDFTLAAGCLALDGGELLFKPLVDSLGILLVGSPKRALGRDAELVEQPAHGSLAEFDPELLLDKAGNHLASPQSERKFELERITHRDCGEDPPEHFAVELGFASASLMSFQRIPPAAAIQRKPVIDCCPVDAKDVGNHFWAFTILHSFDSAHSQLGQLPMCQFPAICISDFLHAK